MGKNSIDIELPSFWEDPTAKTAIPFLGKWGEDLSRGLFLDPSNPDIGFLNPLVSLNPKATQMAVDLASRSVIDQQNIAKNATIQQLEANNQLTSSVTGNALTELDKSFGQDIADIGTKFYLADVERSMQNLGNLFQLGLGTETNAAQLGLTNQSQRNSFNLQNFENALTLSYLNQSLNPPKGGITGGITGAIGGGLQGFAMGGPWGAAIGAGLGGYAGATGPAGTGGSFLNSGSLLAGLSNLGKGSASGGGGVLPGSSATDSVLLDKYGWGGGLGSSSTLNHWGSIDNLYNNFMAA